MFEKLKARILAAAAVATAFTPTFAANAPASSPLDLNLPSLGSTADAELSPSQEHRLGEQLMMQVRSDPTFMTDPEITEYLNHLGYTLVSNAKTGTYSFFFFPIRDKTLNAFALPGGFIAVHTGTIVAARDESELAGVMAHEVSHVAQRHIARMIEGQKGNLALTLGSVLLAILAARAGGNSGGQAAAAIAMGSQAAMIQSQLSFSQDAEREADRMGLQTLYASGFDPRGMEDFFKRLQSNNRFYESAAPAYLSTHPLTVERIADMENRTRQLPTKMHADSADFKFIQMRARVLQETTIDGWKRVLADFNREKATAKGLDGCALDYGISVVKTEQHDRDGAYQAAQAAQACGIKSAVLERGLIRAAFDAAKTPALKRSALASAKKALADYPLSAMIASNYVDLLYALGENQKIIDFVRGGAAMSPTNPDYHALLARSYAALGKKSEQYMHTGEMYALMGNAEAAVYQYTLAQKANDGDFYAMSEIDARLRELRDQVAAEKKEK